MDLEIETSTWMMFFFIISLVASIWKIWAFLPNKALEDDDKTEEAERALQILMLKVIKNSKGELTNQELFIEMTEDSDFDSKLFWRFNLNRLNHLLISYYDENPPVSSIKEIYSSR